MKVWILIVMMVLTNTTGALVLSRAMKRVGEISTLQPRKLFEIFRYRMLNNPLLWIGFLSQVCTFFMFLTALSWADLSLVIPTASLGYVFSLLGARLFLKEKVTKERWIGTLIIGAGVIIVSLGSGQ